MRLFLFLVLISVFLVSSVSASNVTLQSLNPSSQDTVIVGSGDTVRVTGSWHASSGETTCGVMFVAEGGLLMFTGSSRANFGAIWLGDKSNAPFNSLGGGRLIMGANDTLGLWNTNRLGSDDFRFRGANCRIDIDGGSASTRAVIMGMSASSRPHIYGRETDGIFNVRYAKFYRLGSGTATPGLTLGRSGALRTSSLQRVEHSIFDSATVCFYGNYASVLNDCTVNVTRDWSYAGLYLYGQGDSVINTVISHDNRWVSSEHGGSYMLVRIYAPYTVLHGSTVQNVNGSGEYGRAEYGIRLYADYVSMINTTIDGFIWGINSNGSRHDILLDGCIVRYCTHEGILRIENNQDYDWTIQRSVFYGSGHERNSGYADVLINIGGSDPDDLGYKFLYNTFCSYNVGDNPLVFRNHSGGSLSTSGHVIVGNIFIGYVRDIRIANYGGATTHVTCDQFKYNACDNLVVESGCSFAIAGSAYNWADSSIDFGSQYGFVDSASFDFRLLPGSPMIGAGESFYGAQVFGGTGPFDVGYWQTGGGMGVDPGTSDILPTKFQLHQNYPNPFNPGTSIVFEISHSSDVNLTIYNILGRQVRTLANREFSAGRHTLQWDGTTNDRKSVASGVYFYSLASGSIYESKRMVLLR